MQWSLHIISHILTPPRSPYCIKIFFASASVRSVVIVFIFSNDIVFSQKPVSSWISNTGYFTGPQLIFKRGLLSVSSLWIKAARSRFWSWWWWCSWVCCCKCHEWWKDRVLVCCLWLVGRQSIRIRYRKWWLELYGTFLIPEARFKLI